MNTKNFIVGSFVGAIVYFLLGWLVYGFLLPGDAEAVAPNMVYLFLGCLFFAVLLAYVFTKWANINQWLTGAKAGAVLGLFWAASFNFFHMAYNAEMDFQKLFIELVVTTVMGAFVGAAIAFVNEKLK